MPRRKRRTYPARSRGARGGHGHGSRANRSRTTQTTASKRKALTPSRYYNNRKDLGYVSGGFREIGKRWNSAFK